MPLATKNNAIILKDGKLAENCGCCGGGGWYCCQDPTCAIDTISSIQVTIAPRSSSWVRQHRQLSQSLCGFEQYTAAVPCSAVAGTHSMQKSSPTEWKMTLAVDSVGCFSPELTLRLFSSTQTSGQWQFFASNPAYYWHKATTDGSGQFKTLSDMQCNTTPPWSGTGTCGRFTAGHEAYAAELRWPVLGFSQAFQCSPAGTFSFVGALSHIQPNFSSDEKGPPPHPSNFFLDTGSLLCDVSIVIS